MVKECCQDEGNLEELEDPRPDVTVRACQVCGCKHYELSVDPGSLGLKFT